LREKENAMPTGGFEINITEQEFKQKPPQDQNWILFQGVTAVRQCIDKIENEGCEFARKRRRNGTLKLLSAISGGITVALGIVYILYTLIHK
jgi:hypothetical protein